jgi:hypothetical protein
MGCTNETNKFSSTHSNGKEAPQEQATVADNQLEAFLMEKALEYAPSVTSSTEGHVDMHCQDST